MDPGAPAGGRALVRLLDAERTGTRALPGWLGERLRLKSAGTTALVDRLGRLDPVMHGRDTADRRRVPLEVEEQTPGLGRSFFGPVIGEVATAAAGFEAAGPETVRRFLTSVEEPTGRARPA
ncbi:MarR family transcriptional regulator [Streptomyces sp. NPDC055051]